MIDGTEFDKEITEARVKSLREQLKSLYKSLNWVEEGIAKGQDDLTMLHQREDIKQKLENLEMELAQRLESLSNIRSDNSEHEPEVTRVQKQILTIQSETSKSYDEQISAIPVMP